MSTNSIYHHESYWRMFRHNQFRVSFEGVSCCKIHITGIMSRGKEHQIWLTYYLIYLHVSKNLCCAPVTFCFSKVKDNVFYYRGNLTSTRKVNLLISYSSFSKFVIFSKFRNSSLYKLFLNKMNVLNTFKSLIAIRLNCISKLQSDCQCSLVRL